MYDNERNKAKNPSIFENFSVRQYLTNYFCIYNDSAANHCRGACGTSTA